MSESYVPDSQTAIYLTAEVVSAYVSNNPIPAAQLPELIRTVHGQFWLLGFTPSAAPAEELIERPTAAQIRKSITPDALISFIDGKTYKTLRRHLTTHGLDPAGYRKRYGLPEDYPLVSPNYSAKRSELAKALGLGRGQLQAAE